MGYYSQMTPEAPLAAGQATAPAPKSTSLSRLFSVFTSPGATFAELARDPHFILAWCVQIVAAEIFGFLMIQRVGVYAMARQAMMQNPATQAMSPAAQQHSLAIAAVGLRVSFYAAPVWSIVVLLILGGIFLGLANLLLGYEASYKQALAMVSYAFLVMTLYTVIAIIVIALSATPSSLQIKNLVGTNIGYFFDPSTTSKFLYALGSHIGIFGIWTMILLGIGLGKLGGKKGRTGSGLSVVVVLWLLYILASSGLASLF